MFFVLTPMLSDEIREPSSPVMLLRITHMAVAGQHIFDDYAVIVAIDTLSTCHLVGINQWLGHVLQA